MATHPESSKKQALIGVAAWAQAIGLLTRAVFLAVEDAPDFFLRASPLGFVLPILVAGALQITKLRKFLSRNVTGGILAVFVMIISVSTFTLSLADLSLAMSIPEDFVTEGWEYTRTTSLVSTLVFLIALSVNAILSVGVLRGDEESHTHQSP